MAAGSKNSRKLKVKTGRKRKPTFKEITAVVVLLAASRLSQVAIQ